MPSHVEKALAAARQVEHHTGQVSRYAGIRAKNVLAAVELDKLTRQQVAEALGVSLTAVQKMITVARDPEARRAWKAKKGEST
jgi:predicted transcriptional regulator